jgi:hypothetical protein
MRSTRAFISGLGATGTLVAAATAVFLVVSAVVAFNGWPGAHLPNSLRSLVVSDSGPAPYDVPGPVAVAAGAAPAALAVTAIPTATAAVGAPGATPAPPRGLGAAVAPGAGGAAGGLLSRSTLGLSQAATPGTVPPPNGGASGLPQLPPQVQAPVNQATTALSKTVSQTTKSLGDTVAKTTKSLGDTVSRTTGAVGKGTGPVVGPVVTKAGDAVSRTVTDTGKTLSDVLTRVGSGGAQK